MRTYNIEQQAIAATAAIQTLLEFSMGALKGGIVRRAWLSQQSNITSAQQSVQLVRKSVAGTNVTAPVAVRADLGDAAFGGTLRGLCTTVGTISEISMADAFNWVNGWLWLPAPGEEIYVPPAGIFGLHLPVAPAAITINAGIVVQELY